MGVKKMIRVPVMVVGLLLAAGAARADDFPAGPMHDTVTKACTQCHTAEVVTSQAKTREGWVSTVNQMVANGAPVTDAEFDKVVDYLAKNFPAK
jgi:hypothetical protein